MKRARRSIFIAGALCAALSCAVSGDPPAGPGLPGGPVPPPAGHLTSRSSTLVLDGDGGTVSSSASDGGSLSVVVAPGTLLAPTDVTVTELSGNPPPALVGSAYEVDAGGAVFAQPLTLSFTAPAGTSVNTVAIADQDPSGYWFRNYDVTRATTDADPARWTVSTAAGHVGRWALVSLAAQQDLVGTFALVSTEDNFRAAGSATLQYLGTDGQFLLYAPVGRVQLTSPPPGCTVTEASTPTDQAMPLSIAELAVGVKFRWGLNGRWDLACGGASTYVGTNFDSLGITNIGCARSYIGQSIFSATHVLAEEYLIDCSPNGTVAATWDLAPPAAP